MVKPELSRESDVRLSLSITVNKKHNHFGDFIKCRGRL